MINSIFNRSDEYRSIWVSNHRLYPEKAGSVPTIKPVRIDVLPLLHKILDQLKPLAKSKGIVLDVKPFSAELFCETEADCFYLLAYNLIGHSLRDTPFEGRVTIEAYQDGLDFVLSVQNNGQVFTQEEIDFLFGLQVQNTAVFKGTQPIPGMGLDSVKQIVDAHKGQLLAESHHKHGVTYTVKLPLIGDVYL